MRQDKEQLVASLIQHDLTASKSSTHGEIPSDLGSLCNSHPDDRKILVRCEMLGLSLLEAVQLAVASDPADPYSLLRVLHLDFSTYEPMHYRRPKRWLWMAAQNSSISYRGTITEADLLDILIGGAVSNDFPAHLGHFLDETPIDIVVMAVSEAAQRSGAPARTIWRNVGKLAQRHSGYRHALWTSLFFQVSG